MSSVLMNIDLNYVRTAGLQQLYYRAGKQRIAVRESCGKLVWDQVHIAAWMVQWSSVTHIK